MRLLLIVLFSLLSFAKFDATLTVEKKVDQRARVAVVDGSTPTPVAKKMQAIFVADLKISGHFRPDEAYRVGSYGGSMVDPALRV